MLDLTVPHLAPTEPPAAHTSASQDITFRLIPVLVPSQFPAAKLAPGRNNVRSHAPGGAQQPTPGYSSAILQVYT